MTAQEYVPEQGGLEQLRLAARACRGCDLYRDATQTVFGEGPGDARILVVGEQPGDIEDRRGAPFVGPAGKVLDRAFDAAGLDRGRMYVTNAVKHFKHRPAAPGKRRIHQTPDRTEIVACRPWLVAEFARIRPAQVVVLGATAAKAMLGPAFRVTKEHGRRLAVPAEFAAADDAVLVATIHPSAVLRADDRDAAFDGLVEDLRVLTAAAA
ncbi:UdgX family uracil-DNA binding protein [Dactylosporangium aurantiacum]|uniref:Type-4 uracil-DNA glycosylase n=1 Tax=Dactylosporangium aurantiacum TaxID=35754 RepID=A0A9Q9IFM2_9ACTN|nr:UdgX family uracil-DNA binding protein [Dactylosporangium aurantiacum]MDG6100763.1 UdgX family uracil-DNA binding protein [Dactylosporangium aurantiacum]UWZ55172.1 UdgX family uracil-DNA binding protein [Dactylosporangium aurantiacum]